MRTGVYAATSDFGGDGSAELAERIKRAGGELAARVRGTERRASVDDFAAMRNFQTLLAGGTGNWWLLTLASPLRREPSGPLPSAPQRHGRLASGRCG